MARHTLILTFWFVASLFMISCSKRKPPKSQTKMLDYHEETWDSVKMVNALIGEWEWRYVECFWTPDDANYEKYKGLTVEFRADQRLIVKDDGRSSRLPPGNLDRVAVTYLG